MESKHQSFKHWITSDEPLDGEQASLLHLHLEGCEECRQFESSWHSVQRLLEAAPMAAPATGFTARWQERQVAARAQRQKRQTRLFLAFSLSMVALTFALLAFQVLDLLRDPETLGMIWLVRIFSILTVAQSAQEFLGSLFTALAKLPLPAYVLLVGFVSLLCVSWAAAVQQLRRWPNVSGG